MSRVRHHLRNAFVPHAGNDYRPHALRQHWLHTYTGLIVAAKVVMVIAVSVYASPARVSDITPNAIIQLTNTERVQRKINSLGVNASLTKAAEKKAADMAQKNYFAHISPSGTTPWYWFKQAGYTYTYAGENLAIDFVSGEDVVRAWLNSPSHRSNLLSTKYKDIGVAVRQANIDGASSLIVVQMFGAPLKKATKTISVPAQKPTPSTAKQAAVLPVPSKVLGESAQVAPPAIPTILTPADASMVRTLTPEVVGRADAGSVVTVFVNGQRVATATTDATGVYSTTPVQPLPEGGATLQVTATLNGLTSQLSSGTNVRIDASAPTIELQRSLVLPTYQPVHGYTVSVVVTGSPTTVEVQSGAAIVQLKEQGEAYTGVVALSTKDVPGPLVVRAVDAAGNTTETPIADTTLFTAGVVASTSGPFVNGVKIVLFSRTFLMLFLAFMAIIATMNVVIEWRHQHHPTIIHSMLVLFLIGSLLML